MLEIFQKSKPTPNIFEDFAYMDKREFHMRKRRETPDF